MKPVQRAVGEEEGCILQVLKCRHLILLLHLCPVSPAIFGAVLLVLMRLQDGVWQCASGEGLNAMNGERL